MAVGETAEPTPVAHDFAAMVTNFHQMVKHLADGGTDAFDAGQSIGFMQDVERFRNQLSVVDHLMIAAAERLDLPTLLCQGSMRRVLMSALGLSKGEAARRVRAAEAVGPRTSMLGDVLEPVRPVLAAAQHAGEVSAEKVAIIVSALDKVDRRGFDPADIAAGEALLTEHAAVFPPEDLRLLADRVVDAIDPDGTIPNEQLNEDRRDLHLRATRDGAYVGDFRLTGSVGAKLKTLLDPAGQTPGRHVRRGGREDAWAAAARRAGRRVRSAVAGRGCARRRRYPRDGDRHHRRRRPDRTGRVRPDR